MRHMEERTPGNVQITFRDLTPSDSAESVIRERIEELTRFAPKIMSCRVMVEAPHKRHQRGNRYHVRITIHVPGDQIVVAHQPTLHGVERRLAAGAHHKATELAAVDRDLYTAIHEAFDLARRRLQDWIRRTRGKVKTHDEPPHGRVIRLLEGEGYGFIAADDGREIYFHRNAVLGDAFGELDIGSRVSFSTETGDKGPQASTVRLLGKHH